MKECPSCTKVQSDDAMILCPYDGTPLLVVISDPYAETLGKGTDASEQGGSLVKSQEPVSVKPEAQEDKNARRKYLRERLGEFFSEGDKIRWGILAQQVEAHRKHDVWLKQVEQFLTIEPEFDGSHLARFKAEQLLAIKEFIQELSDWRA